MGVGAGVIYNNAMSEEEQDKILAALSSLHIEIERRFTTLETLQRQQQPRCDAHAKNISNLSERTTSLEASRHYVKGVIKAVAVGIPAFGSVAWFVYEFGAALKKMKGGG